MGENSNQKSKKESILEKAKRIFKDCDEADKDNRQRALEDLRFGRLGKQWDEEDIEGRRKEGRPCLTINVMPSNIRQVVNDSRQNRPSIKVHPVDSKADVRTAKIIDGLIRNIEANSRADLAYDKAIEDACSMNVGYVRVDVDYAYDSFDMDIKIERIDNPLTIYGDPYNPCPDGSKWNYAFVSEMLPEEEFVRKYPKAEKVNFDEIGENSQLWYEDKSVRIAEFWEREEIDSELLLLNNGEIIDIEQWDEHQDIFEGHNLSIVKRRPNKSYRVRQYIMNGKEVLKETEWAGKYIPIIPVYGEEINENGKVHYLSLIHHAKDAQRNKNYWRTCATEQVALASKTPWVGPVGFAKKDARWDTANTDNHSFLEYDGQTPPTRQPFPGVPAGALQEAANAADDIKSILGLYDASLGAKSNETSGKAIMARQREGDVSTFHFIDNLTRAIRQVGAIVLDLIPHVYNEERVMRVLGEDGTPSEVQINKPSMVDGVEQIYDLTSGKYDLTVSSGPSFNSRREEAAVQMTDFIKSFPQSAPILGDLLAKNLDWPGADEIAERLKATNPLFQQKEQAPDPEIMKIQAQAQVAQMQAQQQSQQKAQESQQQMMIAGQKAQTDLEIKKVDLMLKEMDLKIKEMEVLSQREKNQVEIVKSQMALETSGNKQEIQEYGPNEQKYEE